MMDRANVLIVDDERMNCDVLSDLMLSLGHTPRTALSGREALESVKNDPPDCVLLDVVMPDLNGFEVLERLKENEASIHIPVIMISGLGNDENVMRCLQNGADDYLTKPFNVTLLKARITNSLQKKQFFDLVEQRRRDTEASKIELERRIQEQVREISSTQLATIFAMSKLAESRDPETGEHLERMREYCRIIAQQLRRLPKYVSVINDTFVENVYLASPLHDIGKVGVPDHILQKPGGLNAEEFAVMKRHCSIGAETLRAVDRQHPGNSFIRFGIQIAESHHEKWDGSGYPFGLAGEGIPLVGRILAVGDTYDALTSKRCYKQAIPHSKSCAIIVAERGRHFDPEIVAAFLEVEQQCIHIREKFKDPAT